MKPGAHKRKRIQVFLLCAPSEPYAAKTARASSSTICAADCVGYDGFRRQVMLSYLTLSVVSGSIHVPYSCSMGYEHDCSASHTQSPAQIVDELPRASSSV